MARSIKKGPYVDANLDGKVTAMSEGKIKKGVIKTWTADTRKPNHQLPNQRCSIFRVY